MKSKIRILNVMTGIDDGGLEMLVYRIYKGLGNEKYDLNICTLTRGEKTFIEEGFRSICNNFISLDFVNKNINIKGVLKNLFQFFKLYKLIRLGNYDVVHSHDYFAAFITRVAVILCKITFSRKPKKVFITYHNIYYWLKPINHFSNKILSYFTNNIICVTKAVKDNSIAEEKIKDDKFIVIRNGVNSKEFFPDNVARKSKRNEIGYNDNDIVICNVGVYSERKGQIYLIQAFKGLLKKFKNIKLALVGSTREYELEIYREMVNYV
jgi:glycosyltransferase involved in cell wall biosynthesis